MKFTKLTYTINKDGTHVRKEEVVEETTALTRAVEAEAEKYPGRIIMGLQDKDEIVFVGPLENCK